MPIDEMLLARIKHNSQAFIELDLSNIRLNDEDIRNLIDLLPLHFTLTTLDVTNNQLGSAGAKTLATLSTLTSLNLDGNKLGIEIAEALATNTTLRWLSIEGSQLGDEDVRALYTNRTLIGLSVSGNKLSAPGIEALVTMPTLTELDVSANELESEGFRALLTTTTLTQLDIECCGLGNEERQMLEQVTANNLRKLIQRRDQFIQALIILARDKNSFKSQSLWRQLPREIMLHIISLIGFSSGGTIGKSSQQIRDCTRFIFDNIAELNILLREKRGVKIMEQKVRGKSQFRFFSTPSGTQQTESATNKQELNCKSGFKV